MRPSFTDAVEAQDPVAAIEVELRAMVGVDGRREVPQRDGRVAVAHGSSSDSRRPLRRSWRGRCPAVVWRMPRMMNHPAPIPMRTSPTENTFASGSGRGKTKMSPRKAKFVPGPIGTEFEKPVTGSWASPVSAIQANGSDGMAPPLARTATRLATAPTAMSGKPGWKRFRTERREDDDRRDDVERRAGRADALGDRRREQDELDEKPAESESPPGDVDVLEVRARARRRGDRSGGR